LLKAIGMFHAKAAVVERTDLGQWYRFLVDPHKPTDTRVPLLGAFSKAGHADHGQFDFACLPHMQVLPGGDLDAMPVALFAFPMERRHAMRAFVVASKTVAIFARGTAFARRGRA